MLHALDDPSLLFQTPNGRVLRCACCSRLEVAFGNIALTDDVAGFQGFRRIVAHLNRKAEAEHLDQDRPYLLSVGGTKLTFRFTREEAHELLELLDGAAAMLELEGVLKDVLHPDGDG